MRLCPKAEEIRAGYEGDAQNLLRSAAEQEQVDASPARVQSLRTTAREARRAGVQKLNRHFRQCRLCSH